MQPSGEVGRFEVVDLPSPPADRQRYPTCFAMAGYKTAMTNPYSPSNAHLNDPRSAYRANSAFKAVLISCRNGLLWSLAVMVPISFLVVPAIPRRLVRDQNGDAVSYIESAGYLGMIQEMLGLVAPIAMIWTLSAGAVGLIRYARTGGLLPLDARPNDGG
ncbi:hypothetical protein [Rubripirellula lacrimiformis]|uniref:hypothetical protein n=1 Tax=Rubripirellula lacrimiformis TaxID=1930273 RepID=UPI0011A7B7D3|nr:hypothetical protein [Rubripirellula lacrimiformis]